MIPNPLVVIRTDASSSIGTGHIMRCLSLAVVLNNKGFRVSFICREHDSHLCSRIEKYGFFVHHLPKNSDSVFLSCENIPPHASWLGISWEEDARQTIQYLKTQNSKPDWLVVDHYALDYRWEAALYPYVHRILVIDDLADRKHICSLLLDQNLVTEMDIRYRGKVPESCVLLLGPEYALLQQEYSDLHDRVPPRSGQVQRIIIFFGGVDSANLTTRAVEALIALNRRDIQVDVVLSERSPQYDSILDMVSGYPHFIIYSNLPSLAPLMVKADIAVGASGTTSWERLCLGLPSIIVTLAENQRSIAQGLQEHGLIRWIGHANEVSAKEIGERLSKIISSGVDETWSAYCQEIVDGRGALRVCMVMMTNDTTPLSVRKVRLSDEKLLLNWANDPVTRKNAFSSDTISKKCHHEWFYRRLRNIDECRIYIVETEDKIPIGQVRFDKTDVGWCIDYSLSLHYRGRGLGKKLLQIAMMAFKSEFPEVLIFGRVMKNNIPSYKVFKSLDFIETENAEGEIVYQRML